jgi:hypothetical protein
MSEITAARNQRCCRMMHGRLAILHVYISNRAIARLWQVCLRFECGMKIPAKSISLAES